MDTQGIVSGNYIYIDTETLGNSAAKILWDMNSFLKGKFNLYRYILSDKEPENSLAYVVKLPQFSLMFNKTLYISELESKYIINPEYTKDALIPEYKKFIENDNNESMDFDEFYDIYCSDYVYELEYIATENMDLVIDFIRAEAESVRTRSGLNRILRNNATVSIGVYNASGISIYTEDESLQRDLIDIISKYLESSIVLPMSTGIERNHRKILELFLSMDFPSCLDESLSSLHSEISEIADTLKQGVTPDETPDKWITNSQLNSFVEHIKTSELPNEKCEIGMYYYVLMATIKVFDYYLKCQAEQQIQKDKTTDEQTV